MVLIFLSRLFGPKNVEKNQKKKLSLAYKKCPNIALKKSKSMCKKLFIFWPFFQNSKVKLTEPED